MSTAKTVQTPAILVEPIMIEPYIDRRTFEMTCHARIIDAHNSGQLKGLPSDNHWEAFAGCADVVAEFASCIDGEGNFSIPWEKPIFWDIVRDNKKTSKDSSSEDDDKDSATSETNSIFSSQSASSTSTVEQDEYWEDRMHEEMAAFPHPDPDAVDHEFFHPRNHPAEQIMAREIYSLRIQLRQEYTLNFLVDVLTILVMQWPWVKVKKMLETLGLDEQIQESGMAWFRERCIESALDVLPEWCLRDEDAYMP